MTRQRIRPSLKRSAFTDCPVLPRHGRGEDARKHGHRSGPAADPGQPAAARRRVTVTVASEVADYLNNKKRHELARLEDEGKMMVQVMPAEGCSPEYLLLDCRDAEGREIKFPVAATGPLESPRPVVLNYNALSPLVR